MMRFFKPEDFYTKGELDTMRSPQQASDLANAKLERESKTVYSYRPDLTWFTTQTTNKECNFCGGTEVDCCRYYKVDLVDTHKALLINIEPVEKCKHEPIKVGLDIQIEKGKPVLPVYSRYYCNCGVEVKPKMFEEV